MARISESELVALRLKGMTCASCEKFWSGSYCEELTDIDAPICGAFQPLETTKEEE